MSEKHVEVWNSNPSDGSCSNCHQTSAFTMRLGTISTMTVRLCLGCLLGIVGSQAVQASSHFNRAAVRQAQHTLEQQKALARYIIDEWLRNRSGAAFDRVLDEMKVGQYRSLFEELALILQHGGKPPNWT